MAAQCLLSLKDQQNQLGGWVCPALSEINDDTLKKLKEIATQEPDDTIPATFECKTSRSVPLPETVEPAIFGEAYE